MNNPIMALAQMAMNRISSDPSFQKNPQARALPESTMVRQITTANAFDSITISDLISVNCCDFDRLTVTNTGAVPVVISTNPLLYIKRVS